MEKIFTKIPIFNVFVTSLYLHELLDEIRNAINSGQRLTIGNVNIYALNLIWENPYLIQIFNSFDIVFCDGFGVKIGVRILGENLPERFTPPDFIHGIMSIISHDNRGVFLLGASPGVAEKAAQKLSEVTPGLRIAGCHHGYFDKATSSVENLKIIETINDANPSVLLVGFGMPLQEKWIVENWQMINVDVVLTVGALFDTLSGNIPRAPKWVTDHGFEWLARFIIEPQRLWERYLIGNPLFFLRVFREKLTKIIKK